MNPLAVRRATAADADEVAVLAGELLAEIMAVTGVTSFRYDRDATAERLQSWLEEGTYAVYIAGDTETAGFVALAACRALYAEGAFGVIPECYVRPAWRGAGVGRALLAAARGYATERGWTRLEVTTPRLPEFARTLAFYEREGFSVSGGRKLMLAVESPAA